MNQTYTPTDRLALLAFKAIRALDIDVPVLRVEEVGDLLRLHLYGGAVVEYPTQAQASSDPVETARRPPPRRAPVPAAKPAGKKKPSAGGSP